MHDQVGLVHDQASPINCDADRLIRARRRSDPTDAQAARTSTQTRGHVRRPRSRSAATARGTSPPSHARTAITLPTVFLMHLAPAAIGRIALLIAEILREGKRSRAQRSIGGRRREPRPDEARRQQRRPRRQTGPGRLRPRRSRSRHPHHRHHRGWVPSHLTGVGSPAGDHADRIVTEATRRARYSNPWLSPAHSSCARGTSSSRLRPRAAS